MGYRKRTIYSVLDGIFAAGAELSRENLHDCPELKRTIFENAERTLRKLIDYEKKNKKKNMV